ncbi:MAG: SpoIIE family protein phosphatase, partial [Chloroflexales bacterium]|nr:SpoIIE family protein phosphatase [Chloroflexales bacterium]
LPADVIRRDLAPAAAEGLIVPVAHPQSLARGETGHGGATAAGHRFAHDRVQQAVYELIPAEERPATHWRIGERLWRAATPSEREAWLFVLVNQLGLGQGCLPDRATSQAVAELHLLAGRKAVAAAAYEPAWRYLRAGTALLDSSDWERRYNLARDLYCEATQAAYLAGDFAAMERLAAIVLERATALLDIVEVYEARIQAYAVQNRMRDAVRTALDILRRLGFALPERPGPAERRRAIAEIQTALDGRPIAALSALPAMTDPTTRAAMRIMAGVASAAYNGMPDLFGLLVARQVTLSISHGIAPESAYAYATYGLLLCNAADIATGAQFGRLATDLANLPEARRHRAKTRQVVHTFITHWQEPLRSVLPLLREDYHLGIETGDVEYAAYALDVQGYGGFVAGVDLDRLACELELSRDAIAGIRQTTALNYLEIFRQAVQNLRGEAAEPWRLAGPIYDAERMVPLHLAANDRPALFFAHVVMLMLCYLWRQYERALAYADLARAYLDGATGSLTLPLFYLYDSLTRLASAGGQAAERDGPTSSPIPAPRSHIQTVRANQRRLRQWAAHAPMNQLHRWHLVEAERARAQGKYGAAREHYDQAIGLAREHGYHADEALACELAGALYATRGLIRLAQLYLGDARDAWIAWGAPAKARELTERYPQLLVQGAARGAHDLDVTSVFRASHAISSEIVLDRLLTTIMQIVIENAGAQRGGLLRGQPGQWAVEVEGGPETGIALGQGRPVGAAELPLSVLNYVAHTRRHVVVDDLARDRQFAGDPYVEARRPRSALCAPLMRQGSIVGLLYLENNLTSGVFTPERVEIVSLLAGQVAISIENAGLYSRMEELVAARTGELTAAYERLKTLNGRLQAELQLARSIQQHLLLPARPAWAGLDVVCSSTPAREVGGDFYLYHAFDPADSLAQASRYALVVGDVSGKGMPAALVMAISLGLFQSVVGQGKPPAALLAQLDQALAPYTRATRQNCALVYVEVSRQPAQPAGSAPAPGDSVLLRVANAGGVTPLIKRGDGVVEWVEIGGLPLGIELASRLGYQEAALWLAPGDMVILISDGVIEASNAGGELFGFERFEQTVRSGPQQGAEAMLRHLQSAVALFGSDAEPHDDMTVVVVRP